MEFRLALKMSFTLLVQSNSLRNGCHLGSFPLCKMGKMCSLISRCRALQLLLGSPSLMMFVWMYFAWAIRTRISKNSNRIKVFSLVVFKISSSSSSSLKVTLKRWSSFSCVNFWSQILAYMHNFINSRRLIVGGLEPSAIDPILTSLSILKLVFNSCLMF